MGLDLVKYFTQYAALTIFIVSAAVAFCGIALRKKFDKSSASTLVISVLMSAAFSFTIPPIYETVDSWMGNVNLTNLILRFMLYSAGMILAYKFVRRSGNEIYRELTHGKIGWSVFIVVSLITIISYAAIEAPESIPGLIGLEDQTFVKIYQLFGFCYPGYLGLFIALSVAYGSDRMIENFWVKYGYKFLLVGTTFWAAQIVLRTLYLSMPEIRSFQTIVAYSGMSLVGISLILFSLGRISEERRQKIRLSLTDKTAGNVTYLSER